MRIGFAQIDAVVGDLAGNRERLARAHGELVAAGAELVLAPELAICGYPPLDLVFHGGFVARNLEALDALARGVGEVPLVVGYIDRNETGRGAPFRNAAAVLRRGRVERRVHKTLLPTYDVFDEARYFQPGDNRQPVEIAGRRVGITICEDIWMEEYLPTRLYDRDPVGELCGAGAEVIVNLSASPYSLGKPRARAEMLGAVARRHGRPVAYCNLIGGNDQLIFDGNSLALGADGRVMARLAGFREEIRVVDLGAPGAAPGAGCDGDEGELWGALTLGLRDYVEKCGFRSVVLGLSGGIDSALTACLAASALGPGRVTGVSMPSGYSSAGSVDDARALAARLGIEYLSIPIGEMFDAFRRLMGPAFRGRAEDETEENMQSRLRGMILMALSNKLGHLLLTTGNKSEMAVGYCTLYGDMAGGLAVISDLPKSAVCRLARWANRDGEIIPVATLEKPPSAELRPDQRDEDTLPPYDVLDGILQAYVEEGRTPAEIVAAGCDEATVRWVARRVDRNEYKRQQAAPGLRVTSKAFGRGRRMPIAQRYED